MRYLLLSGVAIIAALAIATPASAQRIGPGPSAQTGTGPSVYPPGGFGPSSPMFDAQDVYPNPSAPGVRYLGEQYGQNDDPIGRCNAPCGLAAVTVVRRARLNTAPMGEGCFDRRPAHPRSFRQRRVMMFAREKCSKLGCFLEAALPVIGPVVALVWMLSIAAFSSGVM